ncbi:MAG: hypothetical protein ICV78_00805 [Tolypothrix sp. Co-bin9]|nr:hypothetical protein [Tolypothrix sp. Co-bin9]
MGIGQWALVIGIGMRAKTLLKLFRLCFLRPSPSPSKTLREQRRYANGDAKGERGSFFHNFT